MLTPDATHENYFRKTMQALCTGSLAAAWQPSYRFAMLQEPLQQRPAGKILSTGK